MNFHWSQSLLSQSSFTATLAEQGLGTDFLDHAHPEVVDPVRDGDDIDALVDRLGGCERILKTPTPVGFVVLVRQIVLAFLVTLPLSIVDELSAWSVLVVGLVAFPVFAIEALGSELDDPFGRDPNDLPLDRITETIERDVTEQAAASTRYGVVVS